LGENVGTVKKNTESLLVAGKDFSLEADTEKTKYMFADRMQDKSTTQKEP
jgi:hypothetical protein